MPRPANLRTLTIKELRSLFSDGLLIAAICIVFSVVIYNTAHGTSTDVRNASVGIVDLDRSVLSRQIRDSLQPPHFRPPVDVRREEIDTLMDRGELIFVLEIPPHFQRDVLAGRQPAVQLLVDATTMTQAGVGQTYLSQILEREVGRFLGSDGTGTAAALRPVVRVLYNPNLGWG